MIGAKNLEFTVSAGDMTLTRCCILFVCLGGLIVPLAHAEESNKLATRLSIEELGKACIMFVKEGKYFEGAAICLEALEKALGPGHPEK